MEPITSAEKRHWIPACAGMTGKRKRHWISACAGKTREKWPELSGHLAATTCELPQTLQGSCHIDGCDGAIDRRTSRCSRTHQRLHVRGSDVGNLSLIRKWQQPSAGAVGVISNSGSVIANGELYYKSYDLVVYALKTRTGEITRTDASAAQNAFWNAPPSW